MHIPVSIKSRLTIGVAVALLYYAAWRFGVFLIHHDHDVEGFGAHFFFTTFDIRWYVVAAVCIYSVARRFVLRPHKWDVYGPILAVLFSALMYLEIQKYV